MSQERAGRGWRTVALAALLGAAVWAGVVLVVWWLVGR